jgi:hypothetical protein
MKPRTTYWIKHFKQNPEYRHLKFKQLDNGFSGYPPFEFEETLIDVVDLDTFIKNEETRIPLFIGTPMGLFPRLYEIPNFLSEDKIVAILSKSLLTGHVAGLSIIKIPAHSTQSTYKENDKIILFKNEK